MLPLLLLLLAPSRADVLHATLRVDGPRLELVGAVQVPGRHQMPPGDLEVLDAEGDVLATAALPPLVHHRSVLTPEGHETARVEARYLRVVLPWPADADALRLGTERIPVLTDPRLRRRVAGPTAEPVLTSGPAGARLDLVFFAEGYTADRADAFATHVDAVVDHLLGIEPWSAYTGMFNVWRVFTPSTDPGIDTTARPDLVDTPYECHYGCGLAGEDTSRLICCDEAALLEVVDARAPFADGVMVLVDSATYGGSGGLTYSTAYTGDALALQVAAHELGHTLIGLWDEYDYGVGADPAVRYASPNCSPVDQPVSWSAWLDGPIEWFAWHRVLEAGSASSGLHGAACDGRPEASEPGAVCAWSGCSFSDWVRPTAGGCMMHALSDRYCPVCREAVIRSFYRGLGGELVHSSDPPVGDTVHLEADDEVIFTVDAAGPDEGLTWTWTSGGRIVHEGPDLVLRGDDRVCGDLTLTLADPSPWVRTDPEGLLGQTLTWDVRTAACCGCASTSGGSAAMLLAMLLIPRRRRAA